MRWRWGAALLVVAGLWQLHAPARADGDDFAFYAPYFETVGDSQSIPFSYVRALAQDRRGFVWIGTQNGLIRYDGYRFRRYVHDPHDAGTLVGDDVSRLFSAADGRLWIGTEGTGVSVFDPRTELFENFAGGAADVADLSAGLIWDIAETADGAIWIATHDRGLHQYDPASRRFVHHRQGTAPGDLIDDHVRSLLVDRSGDLWIGSAQGLQRRLAGSATLQRVASDPAEPDSLAKRRVMSLLEAADGKLWIGTHDHGAAWLDPVSSTLHWLDVDPKRPDRLNQPWIRHIVQPRPEEIWLGTFNGIEVVSAEDGRVLRHLRHDPALPSGLAHGTIGDFLLDHSNLLWVGTVGGGLQRTDPRQDAFRNVRHGSVGESGLTQSDVKSLLVLADGRILAGTDSNGVDILDRRLGMVGGFRANSGPEPALADGHVLALAQTRDGAIWISTLGGGLHRLDPGAKSFVRYGLAEGLPNSITSSLTVTRDGTLWAGTQTGLARWRPDQGRFEALDPAGFKDFVGGMSEDTEGRLWLAVAFRGLEVLEPGATTPRPVGHDPARASSLVGNDVRGMLVDRAGQLWVDTAQGLDRLLRYENARADFLHVSEELGRPGLYFGGNLLDDADGRLWTQWHVFDTEHKDVYRISRADGLDIGTAWAQSYARTHDGLFLFGGTQGLAVVDPRKFKRWDYEPPLVVTDYKVNAKSRTFEELDRAVLGPQDRSFSVEFSALDYSAPEKLRYQYQLVGFDSGWIEADSDHRSASYSNLWPGDYTLRIRGTNRLGEWSSHELKLPLRITPAFWQTKWFYALATLALMALAYVAYKLRVERLHRRAVELERVIEQRSAALRESLERESQHERLLSREKLASATLLTGGLAHEINNPASLAALSAQNLREQLQSLKGFLHELAGDDEPEVVQALDQRFVPLDGFIDDILDGSRRVAGIVADLRRFSQPDPPEPTRAAVGELLRSTLRLVGAKYKHDVHIVTDLAVDPPLPCFPARLNQVFTNLIVNACDAIESRARMNEPGYTGVLRVISEIVDGELRFRFEDNGVGMDDEVRARIFEPFFTTKPKGKGTGVGLPVSLGIVRELGGRIDVETVAGAGSAFTVALPMQRQAP